MIALLLGRLVDLATEPLADRDHRPAPVVGRAAVGGDHVDIRGQPVDAAGEQQLRRRAADEDKGHPLRLELRDVLQRVRGLLRQCRVGAAAQSAQRLRGE